MNIGNVASAQTASAVTVNLQKKEAKQEEAVIGKLLEPIRNAPGKGGLVNKIA